MVRLLGWASVFMIVLCGFFAAFTLAGDPESGEPKEDSTKQSNEKPGEEPQAEDADGWHTVAAGPFEIEVTLNGVFEAGAMHPIKVELEEWSDLKVVEGVEQGAEVKEGDTLIRFDTEKIDRAIEDAEVSLALSELSLEQARDELERLEESTPLDLAESERRHARAVESMERYLEIERPLSVKNAEFSLESSRHRLAYEQEELDQLQKMYQEDDLTEETEEIILKRQKNAVEQARFSVEQAEERRDRMINVTLPRRTEDMETDLKRTAMSLEKNRVQLPLNLRQKERTLKKTVHELERTMEKLKRMRADREQMHVKAPADGVVYYGSCERGRWSGADGVAANMRPDGSFNPNTTIVTIVERAPMFIRASADESQLYRLRSGIEGVATPSGFPDQAMAAEVASVAPIPLGGQYETHIEVDLTESAPIVPGMNASIKLTAYEEDDALTVPLQAVHMDEPGEPYVCIRGENGEAEKRSVELGWRGDEAVEVVDGLSAGDSVRTKEPGAKG